MNPTYYVTAALALVSGTGIWMGQAFVSPSLETAVQHHASSIRAVTDDTAQNRLFLAEITSQAPALIADCVARDWRIQTPPIASGRSMPAFEENWYKAQPLDSVRTWWAGVPQPYRQWAVCEGHFRDRVLNAITPMIEAHHMLPDIERLLVAWTDTSRFTEAEYASARARSDTGAANIVAAATKIGNPRLFDRVISTYYSGGRTEYQQYRARALALLGRTYLALGQLEDARGAAQASLYLERYYVGPLLSDIALRQGDTVAAIRYLTLCRLIAGECSNTPARDSATSRHLDALYRAINHGSLAGRDTFITAALRDSLFRFPVPITPWKPTRAEAGRRVVLLQYYTWAHCGNCAPHTVGAEALEKRFGDNIIVLSYHYQGPLTIPGWLDKGQYDTNLRRIFYIGSENTTDRNVPRGYWCDWWISGACMFQPVFAGFSTLNAFAMYNQAVPLVERQLNTPPAIQLQLRASLQNDRVIATTSIDGLSSTGTMAGHTLKLHLLLVEDSLLISGANNSPIQNRVVRVAMGDSATNFGVHIPRERASYVKQDTFDLGALERTLHQRADHMGVDESDPSTWSPRAYHLDRRHLSLVAYVQDQVTGEVLQAVQRRL